MLQELTALLPLTAREGSIQLATQDSTALAYWEIISQEKPLYTKLEHFFQHPPDSLPSGLAVPGDRRQWNKTLRKKLRAGLELDISSIIFVTPTFQVIDERLPQPRRFIASARKRARMMKWLTEYTDDIHLSATILDAESLTTHDAQTFNDIAILNDWLAFFHQVPNVSLMSPFYEEIEDVLGRHGTPYVAWLGYYTFTRNRIGKPLVLAAGFLLPPLLPYALYYVFTPRHDTVLYTQVYDIANHRYRLVYPHVMRLQDRNDLVKSQLYHILSQLPP